MITHFRGDGNTKLRAVRSRRILPQTVRALDLRKNSRDSYPPGIGAIKTAFCRKYPRENAISAAVLSLLGFCE